MALLLASGTVASPARVPASAQAHSSPLALKPFEDLQMPLAGVFGSNDGDRNSLLSRASAGLGLEIFEGLGDDQHGAGRS